MIGLDGVDERRIAPWMEAGELPFLRDIFGSGSSGVCRSTFPPVSLPAWPSFLTGKNPGNHGLISFSLDGPRRVFFDSRHIGTESLPQILSDAGRTVVCINVPGTYPPFGVKGCLVSGMLTPSRDVEFTYPLEVKNELLETIGDYIIDYDRKKRGEAVFENIRYASELRFKASLYLWERFDWDAFVVIFTETDRLQHRFWHEEEKLVVLFKQIDGYLAEFYSRLRPSDLFVIVSDHGFTEIRRHFFLNSWLRQKGFLRTKLSISRRQKRKRSWSSRFIPRLRREIDWKRTVAYSYSDTAWGVRMNLEGRDERGCVPEAEYESVRAKLIEELGRIEDDGGVMFSRVVAREELYDGKFSEWLPDIFLIPSREGYGIKRALDRSEFVVECDSLHTGHTEEGLVVLDGDIVQKRKRIEAKLVDFMPTVLCVLGVEIPEDVDGRVLSGALKEEFLSENPPRFRKPKRIERAREAGVEDEEVNERLRQLGYLD